MNIVHILNLKCNIYTLHIPLINNLLINESVDTLTYLFYKSYFKLFFQQFIINILKILRSVDMHYID